jgi:adenylate cyclase class 2
MAEIEIKILGIDPNQVATKLMELGATEIFSGLVKCRHFDFPDGSIRKSHALYRLRRWEGEKGFDGKFEVCYKGPKEIVEGAKVRDEVETTVEDADKFEEMMMKLGYEVTMNNDKRRRSFNLGEIHVDIDEYPEVPAYMEIEGPNSEAIQKAVQQLELDEFEQSTETANELFERVWPEVDFDNLKF